MQQFSGPDGPKVTVDILPADPGFWLNLFLGIAGLRDFAFPQYSWFIALCTKNTNG
jgi:hypothetical protein